MSELRYRTKETMEQIIKFIDLLADRARELKDTENQYDNISFNMARTTLIQAIEHKLSIPEGASEQKALSPAGLLDAGRIINLLEEIIKDHADPESLHYNECDRETEKCMWCEDAERAIRELKASDV